MQFEVFFRTLTMFNSIECKGQCFRMKCEILINKIIRIWFCFFVLWCPKLSNIKFLFVSSFTQMVQNCYVKTAMSRLLMVGLLERGENEIEQTNYELLMHFYHKQHTSLYELAPFSYNKITFRNLAHISSNELLTNCTNFDFIFTGM